MTTLGIVIVNWNAKEHLRNCVNSILKSNHSNYELDKIVVVDNGSIDNSLEQLPSSDKLLIIKNNENLGFGKACNIGAKEIRADLILMLNPDTILYLDTLDKSVEFYLTQSQSLNFGILGVQLFDENGKVQQSCSRFKTLSTFFCDGTGLSQVFKSAGEHMRDFDHLSSRVVDQVIGAYYFLSFDIYNKLHGFDEDYFVYYEDMDFALRAKQLKIRSYYYVGARAIHIGGGCTEQVKATRLFYSLNSRFIYLKKHFSLINRILISGITLFLEPIARITFFLFRLNFIETKETIYAYGRLYKKLIKF